MGILATGAFKKDKGEMLKNISKYISKNLVPISVIVICIYAFYLRIMHLYHHDLWMDEMSQLGELKRTFLELVKSRPKAEFCSYLSGDFYLMYPFFKIFSYNKWGLAIPHIIFTIAGFYILYLICRRYFKSLWAYLITFIIVCFNATLINHATEIRTYAVLPTLALAVFYVFQRIADLNFKLNVPKKIWAIVFFVLVIWFHVYGLFMFISIFLFTILSRYKTKDFKICLRNGIYLVAIILGVAMPLWLYSVLGPHVDATPYTTGTAGTFEYIPNPVFNIAGFLKGIFCNLVGHKNIYFLLIGAIIPFVFSYEDKYKQLLFLSFNIIMPIAFLILSDIISNYWFMQRQFVWVIPFFAFYLGWSWDSFFMTK